MSVNSKRKRERNICCIDHCRSYRDAHHWPEPLTFHEFPADLTRRKLWLEVIGKQDWIPGDKAKLCGVHFAPDCYRVSDIPTAQKRLTVSAVPSLNLFLDPLADLSTKTHSSTSPVQSSVGSNAKRQPSASVSKVFQQDGCVCSVPHCQSYRQAKQWTEPLSFHELPSDPEKYQNWVKVLKNFNWIPTENALVCSVHFKNDDYYETGNKRTLKPTAFPSLKLNLKKLADDDSSGTHFSIYVDQNKSQQVVGTSQDRSALLSESRKRFSNIIVVDLIKDNKKAKHPEKPRSTNVDEGCSCCLELKKEFRELEFQLSQTRKELEEQKKLVEKLKKQQSFS